MTTNKKSSAKRHERTRARRCALQVFYTAEIQGCAASTVMDDERFLSEEGPLSDYARSLIVGVEQNLAAIDQRLKESSENWSVDRMPVVDRMVLRMAVYEMEYVDMVPVSVAINEAVELAKDLTLQAEVVKGILNVKLTKGMIFNGDATAAFNVNASQKSVLFKMDVKRLNLKQALAAAGDIKAALDFRSGSETDIVVNLIGQGDTFADVVDTLNGHFITIMEQSQLHIGNIGLLKGNIISQLLDTLRITKGNDDLNLRCAVVRADLKDGKAQIPNGITVNADKFTIVATGDVNLKKDELNLSFKPFAGKLTDTNLAKVLSSLVKLTGTIQKPKIRVDSANAIKTIVGVTTTGPVYLGSQMLLENDGSPCYTALQGTGLESRFPKPENVVTQTTNDVGQIFDDSVGAVKDTTKGIIDILSGSVKSLSRTK